MTEPIIVTTEWLQEHLRDPNVRVIDARVADPRLPMGYRAGHIPHAVPFDLNLDMYELRMSSHRLKAPEAIAETLGARGISNDATIVIYDEDLNPLAGTTYWLLKYLGHNDVRVLDGGWNAWRQAKGEITNETPTPEAVKYTPHVDESQHSTAEWIQENASRADVVLLDARMDSEYYMGHVPGAVNLSFDAAMDVATRKLKAPDVMRAQLEDVGATPDKEIVVYCGSGARSSHTFLVLKSLGYPRVRNYKGSMMDWSARGLPIE